MPPLLSFRPWAPRPTAIVAIIFLAFSCAGARAETPACADLRTRIAHAEGANAEYRAAAARQQEELRRTALYGRQLGCDREQFLFFGDAQSPRCGPLNARLSQMRAALAALDQRASTGKDALVARYNAQCLGRAPARALRPRNFFEELFGVAPADEGAGLRDSPFDREEREVTFPSDPDEQQGLAQDGHVRGGSQAVCVRACDGGFFPLSVSARNANLDELASLCRALCPNAEVQLFTKSPAKNIETAISMDGSPYAQLENASKFEKTHDPACGCKPPDKSWAEALADAEALIAANNKDTVVTPEQAEQLSRPLPPTTASANKEKSRNKRSTARQDAALPSPAEASSPALAGGTAKNSPRALEDRSVDPFEPDERR